MNITPKIKRILLSVAVLVLLLTVTVGFTYSWIESAAVLKIANADGEPLVTGSVPSNTAYNGTVLLDPTVTSVLDITDYDKTANAHRSLSFSPVSSADGFEFFFPDAFDPTGAPISYRKSDVNDIGTAFIAFDIDIKAVEKCAVAFATVPTVTAERDLMDIADVSGFKIMISDGSESGTHIFAATGKATSFNGVTDVNGTATSVTTEISSDYLAENTSDGLFSFEKDAVGKIHVAVWLDCGTELPLDLFGADIDVNIELSVIGVQ